MCALRRAQPPPTAWRTAERRERRFWAFLGVAPILTTLVPIAAGFSDKLGGSGAGRALAALVITAIAGLVVVASATAPGPVLTVFRRMRR
jgi:hypothetical protein